MINPGLIYGTALAELLTTAHISTRFPPGGHASWRTIIRTSSREEDHARSVSLDPDQLVSFRGHLIRIYTDFHTNWKYECRTKHPGTKHPMPFFATPDKTSRFNLPPRTKHPMQFLSPRTKHPMPFLPPRTKHPMLLLPPRTKHPTLCLKPMKVHKTSHLVNCHYYYWYS